MNAGGRYRRENTTNKDREDRNGRCWPNPRLYYIYKMFIRIRLEKQRWFERSRKD